jgi:hypothetical protein
LNQNKKKEIKIKQPPNTIYIHCDLIESSQVMLETNYSQILARIELDKVGEKVFYTPYDPLYIPINDDDYISSIRFWVTDCKRNLINTGIYPMNLVVEFT